ncbi:hypothetical protein KIN20_005486 [Parelaphostrongylus tenuis]|uniref:Uncharacterized protein n=1 Tax=Parelaphostrongylus tenuis TaxID=148309 RepID=A0AAD5M4L1_PARTN|nr:hypothetical protein KIN20_005486 [Parelaphostrongylus tenuis]
MFPYQLKIGRLVHVRTLYGISVRSVGYSSSHAVNLYPLVTRWDERIQDKPNGLNKVAK